MAIFQTSVTLLLVLLQACSHEAIDDDVCDQTSLLQTSLAMASPGKAFASRAASSAHRAVIAPREDATAAAALQEHDSSALLQTHVSSEAIGGSMPPNPANWFGGFSEGESTYNYDATLAGRNINKQINVMDGWNPAQKNPFYMAGPMEAAVRAPWFQESKSGGEKEAWQTFYPSEKTTMAGGRTAVGEWFEGAGGTWQQAYKSDSGITNAVRKVLHNHDAQHLSASWFDDSVAQVDGFGREKFPALGSPRNYFDWEERSVNTSLTCKAPGCSAKVSLVAPFNSKTEMYKNCRLSVFFHPTDFDDQYAGENVEWVQVNDRNVSAKCRPYAAGCNHSASRPLIPCVSDIPIDLLMPENGDLKIAAKIPDVVDECPYNGNMLSAVPMVTCLVAPKHTTSHARKKALSTSLLDSTCVTKMPLQCATKGCASEIVIPVNSTCAGLGSCMLSIEVQQTDFDNQDGTLELIEYIKVDGKEVASKLKPGKNPCKSQWGGKKLKASEMKFKAISNHVVNITSLLEIGRIHVEGKISRHVDECASNGYLFDAEATVTCKAPSSLVQVPAVSDLQAATDTRARRQLKMEGRTQR